MTQIHISKLYTGIFTYTQMFIFKLTNNQSYFSFTNFVNYFLTIPNNELIFESQIYTQTDYICISLCIKNNPQNTQEYTNNKNFSLKIYLALRAVYKIV